MSWFGITVIKTSTGSIPYDVALNILECFREDKKTLSNCAMVCKVWAEASRPHQYYRVTICSQRRLNELVKRLNDDSSIRTWIQIILMKGQLWDSYYLMGGMLTRLHTVNLVFARDQQSLPHFLIEIPPHIQRRGYFPALHTIIIKGIRGVSQLHPSMGYSLLHCFPRLHRLWIDGIDWNQSAGNKLQTGPEVFPELLIQSMTVGNFNPDSSEFYHQLVVALNSSVLHQIMLISGPDGWRHVVRVLRLLMTKLKPEANLRLHLENGLHPSVNFTRSLRPVLGLPFSSTTLTLLSDFEYTENLDTVEVIIPVPVTSNLALWVQFDGFIASRLPVLTALLVTPKCCYDFVTENMEIRTARILFPRCLRRQVLYLRSGRGFQKVI